MDLKHLYRISVFQKVVETGNFTRAAQALNLSKSVVSQHVSDLERELNVRRVDRDELLRESDIVTLHVPLNRHTRAMLSDREFDMMRDNAVLINACRGPVVDEAALYRALTEGKIAGAAVDVLEVEPTPADNPLFDLDNVIITPHMAGQSQETALRAAHFAYGNILRVLSGQEAESLVTPE